MNYHELEEPPMTPSPMGRNCSSLKYSFRLLELKHEANGEGWWQRAAGHSTSLPNVPSRLLRFS